MTTTDTAAKISLDNGRTFWLVSELTDEEVSKAADLMPYTCAEASERAHGMTDDPRKWLELACEAQHELYGSWPVIG